LAAWDFAQEPTNIELTAHPEMPVCFLKEPLCSGTGWDWEGAAEGPTVGVESCHIIGCVEIKRSGE